MNTYILDCFDDEELVTDSDILDKRVLEVGSYQVNGSVRWIIEAGSPGSYLGVDIQDGPGVDQLVNCEDLIDTFGYSSFDLVISTEMLEHVENWQRCVVNLAGVVAEDGVLIVTTRSPGFPYHDYPHDYWRYTPDVMDSIITALGLEVIWCLEDGEAPGVLIKARKPKGWQVAPEDALEAGELQPEPMVGQSAT